MTELLVTEVRLSRALDQSRGLVGWLSFVLNENLRLDGIALRRTREGDLRLSFPERRDSDGRRHPVVRPLDAEARDEIEAQVFQALEAQEVRA